MRDLWLIASVVLWPVVGAIGLGVLFAYWLQWMSKTIAGSPVIDLDDVIEGEGSGK